MENPLQQSIAEITGLDGTDLSTITETVSIIAQRMATRWSKIREVATDPESNGKVTLGISVKLDFTGRAPAGNVRVSFSSKVVDEGDFYVTDPDQSNLPLNVTVTVKEGVL
jgi:hypothetical protein